MLVPTMPTPPPPPAHLQQHRQLHTLQSPQYRGHTGPTASMAANLVGSSGDLWAGPPSWATDGCWAQPHPPSPDCSTQHCQALEYARLPGFTQVTTSGCKMFPTVSFKCWLFSLPGSQANYSPLPQAFALPPSPHLSPVTNCLLLFKGLFQTFKKYKNNATKDNPPETIT